MAITQPFRKIQLLSPAILVRAILLLFAVLFLFACDPETGSNSGASDGGATGNTDAGGTHDGTPGAGQDGTHDGSPDTPGDGSDNPLQTIPTGPRSFSELFDMFSQELVLNEYKEVKMDPLDQVPRFNEANESLFRRYQRIKPTKVDRGMKTYPRFILKGYRFATENAADRAVTKWLNQFDSSADSIALGQEVKAVKSPPFFCSLRENAFFILQTACVYEHSSQDSLKDRYFNWMEETGGRMGWEIGCDAGRLTYRFQNDL